MASNLSVIFNAVDNISSKLSTLASAGRTAIGEFQSIENSANNAFSAVESGATSTASSLGSASSAADALASSVSGYGQVATSASQSSESLASSGNNAEGALTATASAADEAADEIERYGESAEESGNRSEEFGEKSTNAISDLNSMLASAGIVVMIHQIAEEFANCAEQGEIFETSIAQLQTISGGDSIGMLQNDIMSLSNDTGQAAEGLAETAYNAISAGTAVEESVEMAATATELATSGFTDTTSALSVLETAMNSYGDAAGSAEHISDSLITVQNLGVTTVAQLAAQMGKAISTASAYNVSLENLESGYISVTKAGINTAEGTTYLSSMLNELGNSGSEISKLLQKETGETFGQLMNEGKSLADVLGIVYDSCGQNAEAMMNMWGSAEAGKAANAIIGQGLDNFNNNLVTLQTSTKTTATAYDIMANTTEYSHNKMDNAAKNLQITIGEVLNPTLEELYNIGTEIFGGISEFVKEHPVITKAIMGFTVGIAAFTAAVTVAEAAAKLFNGTLFANPLLWLVGGAAALTAGLFALSDAWENATDSTNELTFASQEQKTELDKLNKEYDEACEKYGENSEQASELALQIRRLEDSYGEAGETVGQFMERIEELGSALDDIYQTYNDNISSADKLYGSSTMLIGELQALQNQTNLTDGELQLMKQIVAELNGSYDELGLTISKTGKTNFSPTDLFDYAKAQAEQQKMDAASEGLVGALGKYDEVKSAYEQAGDETSKAWDNYEKVKQGWIDDHPVLSQIGKGAEINWSSDVGKAFDQHQQSQEAYQKASDTYKSLNDEIREYCEQLGYTSDETEAFIAELEGTADAADKTSDKFNKTEEAVISYEDGIKSALDSVSDEVDKLAEAYDDAYDSALDSISGQYDLWDKVGKIAKTSVDKIGDSIDSQTKYWDDYASNLENLSKRDIKGLDEMVAGMDDGSEKSASALAAMASASDDKLEKLVKKYSHLQDAQGKTADKVADLATEFSSSLDEMNSDLKNSIDKMNMEEGAASAAQKTIQSYINKIKNMTPQAESAANAVAKATEKALNSSYEPSEPTTAKTPTKLPKLPGTSGTKNLPGLSLPGHADGTTDSEKAYVAGEEGPELILSGGGDTVFPASETDRIVSAISEHSDNRQIANPPASVFSMKQTGNDNAVSTDKTITIRLEGSGSLGINKGSSKEEVWEGIKGNIKSAFMQILQEEIYEEGAESYEF